MWSKETFNMSTLTKIRKDLEEKGEACTETVLGVVHGRGINDITGWDFDKERFVTRTYILRKLVCRDYVILEQMQRAEEPDEPDFLASVLYATDEVPDTWELEILYDPDIE